MKKSIHIFFLILFPLVGYSQRVILPPDRGFKAIPRNYRSMAVDTITNQITLTLPGSGSVVWVPNEVTVVPIVRAGLINDLTSTSLTAYSAKKVDSLLAGVSGGASAALRYDTPQTLDGTQKTTARTNIDAETTGNKVTTFTAVSNSTYPTSQAVKTELDVKPTLVSLTALRGSGSSFAPDRIVLTDTGREFEYRKDVLDTTTPDNNGTVLRTAANICYKLVSPDRILTPYHFGAKGDSLTDDGAAILAWIQQPGYKLIAPIGKFRSAVAAPRTNMGAVTIEGAGSSLTKFYFSGNTDGISISNTEATSGMIVLRGFSIYSAGTKSAGKKALYINSQDVARPGPYVEDVYTWSIPAGQEWTTHMHLHDCSHVTLQNVNWQGGSYSVGTGLAITNTSGKPSTEINVMNVQGRALTRLVSLTGLGTPAIEGVSFVNVFGVGVKEGIVGSSAGYNAPQVAMVNVHINTFGGRAISLSNFGQISFKGCLFYVNPFGGVTPDRAVYLDSPIMCSGDFLANTLGNTPYVVEFAGTGGGVNMDLAIITNYGSTSLIQVASGYASNPPQFGLEFIWTGANGPSTAAGIVGPGRQKFYVKPDAVFPADGSALKYNASSASWKAVNGIQSTLLLDNNNISTSQTIDPSQFNMFRLANGSSAITVTLDVTKLTQGQYIFFNRENETHTGTVTLVTSNTASNKFQLVDGSKAATYAVPKTKGARAVAFHFNGADLQLISGGIGIDDASTTSETDMWSAYKSALETVNSRARANHTGTNPLSSISTSGATSGQVVGYNGSSVAWTTPSATPSGSAGGDLSGTYPSPGVAKINGVSVPSSPSSGQAIVATGSTAATWQPVAILTSGKIDFSQLPAGTANTQTGTTYTLIATDCNKTLRFTSSSAVTVTVPASIVAGGCSVNWTQKGTGLVTFAAGSGLTLTYPSNGGLKSGGQHAMGTIFFDTTTEATLGGNIVP